MITVESLVPYLAGALILRGVAVAPTRRRELMIRWCIWAAAIPVVTGPCLGWATMRRSPRHRGRGLAAVEFGALMRLGWIDEAILPPQSQGWC